MFGFLVPDKSRWNHSFEKTYMAHYCGLCDALSKEFGLFGRCFTNSDTTFIYLLTTAQINKKFELKRIRCPIGFRKREALILPELARFISAISVVLVYEKMLDDKYDEKKSCLPVVDKFITKCYTKSKVILSQFGFPVNLIHNLMETQRMVEKADTASLTELANPTAVMLRDILGFTAKLCAIENKVSLEKIGYNLGRLVYVLDSIMDYHNDIKSGRFNAVAKCCPKIKHPTIFNEVPDEFRTIIFDCLKEIDCQLNQIKFYQFKEILMNILSLSLTNSVNKIFANEGNTIQPVNPVLLEVATRFIFCVPFTPSKVFAAEFTIGSSCENFCSVLILLGILILAFRFILKGCCSSPCGSSGSDKIEVDQGCAGKKTYYRGWDGKYRDKPSSGCC